MVRPIILMAEIEPPEGLSGRKLVLETGKFNVITAYSVEEALETLSTFPKVNVVVLHASICKKMECDSVIAEVKKRVPGMMTIALSPTTSQHFELADHNISSHEPHELLNLLRSRFGDPRLPAEKPQVRRRA
ncbi:MAG TPA: response regulator [Candidatus Angelobacter sp.]|nr:response regulator [Candidatus Angelobacter sp.]